MRQGLCALILSAATASGVFLPTSALAQTAPVLTGQISSANEGAMEGVLVSARKNGSSVTVTVVSDKDGRYSFPAGKLEPGQYTLRIRAIGYDLDNGHAVEVAAQKSATFDLK